MVMFSFWKKIEKQEELCFPEKKFVIVKTKRVVKIFIQDTL